MLGLDTEDFNRADPVVGNFEVKQTVSRFVHSVKEADAPASYRRYGHRQWPD